MIVKAGEKAQQAADLQCEECQAEIHVNKGEKIPTCDCGSDSFEPKKAGAGAKPQQEW